MAVLVEGNYYLLKDVHNYLGGNQKGFLIHNKNNIVGAHFNRFIQPLAPDTVFVWQTISNSQSKHPKRNSVLANQWIEEKTSIPIFVSTKNSYEWEYKGKYKIGKVRKSPKDLKALMDEFPRKDHKIIMALDLKKVPENE